MVDAVAARDEGQVDASAARRRTLLPAWLRHTLRIPHGAFGVSVVVIVALAAVVSLVWTPQPLWHTDPANGFAAPSPTNWLGTDQIGRDTFSWLLAGCRATLIVAVGATVLTLVLGVTLGALSASIAPRWAEPLIVVIDVIVAFPILLIAMLLATSWGGSLTVVWVAVGVGLGVNLARVIRSEIIRVNASDYVVAARAAGTSAPQRLRLHVLPNVAPVLVVQLSVSAGVAILAEAGLTFLGFGASTSEPSWGRVLADAQRYITVAPLSVLWPGLVIGITVLAINLLGDAIAESLDPRLRTGGGDHDA